MKKMGVYFKMLLAALYGGLATIALAQSGGFIVPHDSMKSEFPIEKAVYLPTKGFNFYGAPNGNYAGRILSGPPQNPPGTPAPIPSHLKNLQASMQMQGIRPQALDLSFFFETYDDCYYVSFDKREDGFLRITNGASVGWLSIEEVEKAGFKVVTWVDFYSEIGKIIVPPSNTKSSLRSSPYADAETLVKIDEDYFEVEVTAFDEGLSREGSFCYVKATQFKIHPCYGGEYDEENVVKVYEGWIQVVDLDGQRLIFHNSHGC